MNLLLLVLNTAGKGTYWRALGFARHLAKRRHHVTLVFTSPHRKRGVVEEDWQGVKMVETPDLFSGSLRSGWDLWNAAHRIYWLGNRRYDLVHAFESRPTVLLPALYFKYIRKTPLVFDWADWFGRGGSVEERPNPAMRLVLRPIETHFEEKYRILGDGMTVICSVLRDKAIRLGIPPETIALLPNGSDTERIYPIETSVARKKLGLSPHGLYIGYLGSIFPRDAILMARAFEQVQKVLPQTGLLVIGNCSVDISRLTKSSSAVMITGYVEENWIPYYLAACDLLWLPLCNTNANSGRWPMKLNDYLAAGRPVVATAVGDIPTLFTEEEVGLLAPDAPEPFAEQTVKLLQDPAMRAYFGNKARAVALTRYNWDKLTDQLLCLYTQVINRT